MIALLCKHRFLSLWAAFVVLFSLHVCFVCRAAEAGEGASCHYPGTSKSEKAAGDRTCCEQEDGSQEHAAGCLNLSGEGTLPAKVQGEGSAGSADTVSRIEAAPASGVPAAKLRTLDRALPEPARLVLRFIGSSFSAHSPPARA